jgi:hypothetical protein
MCGVRTNIVTAVEIKDRDASDTKLLPALVTATAKNFKLNEVSADKGYGSLNNYDVIKDHGAVPYIAFKSIHTGRGGGLWGIVCHNICCVIQEMHELGVGATFWSNARRA